MIRMISLIQYKFGKALLYAVYRVMLITFPSFYLFLCIVSFSFKMMIKSVNLPTAGRGHKGGCYICISWGKIKVLTKEKRLFVLFPTNLFHLFVRECLLKQTNKQINGWLWLVIRIIVIHLWNSDHMSHSWISIE